MTLLIGFGALFGWRSLQSAIQDATQKAEISATATAMNKVETEIQKGTFNDLVTQAVDKIALSNMLDPEDDDE